MTSKTRKASARKGASLIPIERIAASIYVIRDQKVMIDSDLALLYQVETRALVQAVKRNLDRFPVDFMFQLSKAEFEHWRSQIVISNPGALKGLRSGLLYHLTWAAETLAHEPLHRILRFRARTLACRAAANSARA